MSALSGIWHWDGRPVGEALATLGMASRLAGPHGGGTATPTEGLVLQTQLLHFDSLSTSERQPKVLVDGTVVTWDGRLDSREDLLIRLRHDLGSDQSDAAIVAAAYARWGTDCLPLLVGDWSLAIWDAGKQRLLLARDYMGNRPLYYLERPGMLVWATCLDALVDAFGLASQPDDVYIVGRLTFGASEDLTPYTGVRKLPAGHRLLATRNSVQTARYWFFTPADVRYSRPQDYTDRLRELLTEAVRVRLRSNRAVWSHLSGGFDSSSIVCLAARLIASGQAEARKLQPVTMVGTENIEYSEMDHVNAVLDWCNLTTVQTDYPSFHTFEELLEIRRPSGFHRGDAIEEPVLAAGDQIVFSGAFGDPLMHNTPPARAHLLQHLKQGHPLRFLQQMSVYARARHRPFGSMMFGILKQAYHARTPPAIGRSEARAFAQRASRTAPLAERFGVAPATLLRAPDPQSPDMPSLEAFPWLTRPLVSALYHYGRTEAALSSDEFPTLWWTHPYSHRPLVEFILAAPVLSLWEPTGPRVGMLRALADVLPPKLLARRNKGDMNTAHLRRKEERVESLIASKQAIGTAQHWQLVKRGYLESQAVTEALATLRKPEEGPHPALFTWLTLEAWLRGLVTAKRSWGDSPGTAKSHGLIPVATR